MKNPLLAPELRELIKDGKAIELKSLFESGHPVVVAEFLAALAPEEAWRALQHADPAQRAEIFSNLDQDFQAEILATLDRNQAARLLSDMPPDDRADLFKKIPEDKQEEILPAMAQAEREDIRRLSSYEEGTAGAVMTSDYATLTPELTAAEAIEQLRREAPNTETIYYAYVVDPNRRLLGFVSLKDLILARPDQKVKEIMHPEVIHVRVDEDQETAARKIQKYDLLALPVINGGDALVGIITHDDAIDIITQEQTEDMEKLMAIGGAHEVSTYMKTSAWGHFRNRCGWIVILAMIGLISGAIVQRYEALILQFAILATFMPMLADTGGNTGSQSATLVVRALAIGEVRPGDVFKVLRKELGVAVLLALVLGVLTFGRVIFFGQGEALPAGYQLVQIGWAIGIALGLQVITSTLIGALLPIAAAKLNYDPAVVASPALTTVVDITGLLIYFTTAKIFLGI